MQKKVTEKQLALLRSLYKEQGRILSPAVEHWLANLPAIEAPKYIEKWIAKNRRRKRKF